MSFALASQSKNKEVRNKTSTPVKRSSNRGVNDLALTTQDSIIQLQKTIGNQAVQRLMRSKASNGIKTSIQPKLKVSQPGDVYEQEADRVAEQVMRMSAPSHIGLTLSNEEERIDRKCSSCKMKKEGYEEEETTIRRKVSARRGFEKSKEAEYAVDSVQGTGSTFDKSTLGFMESRFGFDFSNVRVHRDETAAESAETLGALAYTHGNDVVFGPGQYSPGTRNGRRLIAHELTHVIQQAKRADNKNTNKKKILHDKRQGRSDLDHFKSTKGSQSLSIVNSKIAQNVSPMATTHAKGVWRQLVTPLGQPPNTHTHRLSITTAVKIFEANGKWYENDKVIISQADFEDSLNSWYKVVLRKEEEIDRDLGGDPSLKSQLRLAYTKALRSLMTKAAKTFGRKETDLYSQNNGRIPMWAWLIPHHMEPNISTPIPQGAMADRTGRVIISKNGFNIVILPDISQENLGTSAQTTFDNDRGRGTLRYERNGQFTPPSTPTMTIQTHYGNRVTSATPSGYGRGTTPEDIAGGKINPRSTQLGFHEGNHGLLFMEFLENNPPIQFNGSNGMGVVAYNNEIIQWRQRWSAYERRLTDFSNQRTDCVGITIDQYNREHPTPGARIILRC